MNVKREQLRTVLQFYLNNMELEDKIFEAIEEVDEWNILNILYTVMNII